MSFAHIPKKARWSLEHTTHSRMSIGYRFEDGKTAWQLYDLYKQQLFMGCHVHFWQNSTENDRGRSRSGFKEEQVFIVTPATKNETEPDIGEEAEPRLSEYGDVPVLVNRDDN